MILMKILLFSNYNPFALSLISRLNKEGHQVFVVTGSDVKDQRKPKDVFQEYAFKFTSSSLPYILKNIAPDIAIFGGSLDNLAEYNAGITNIMLSLNEIKLGKLLYISSLSIFSGSKEQIINENTEPIPLSDRDKTILTGERIVREYSQIKDYQVTIVRLSEMYGHYKNSYLENNICTEICKKMIRNETIELLSKQAHHLLYIEDAVDGVYKVMQNEGEKNKVFHVVGEENIYLETEIIDHLKTAIPYETKVTFVEKEGAVKNTKYRTDKMKALGFNEKYQLKDKIEELYYLIEKGEKRADLLEGKHESILGRLFKINDRVKDKMLPYLENSMFFIFLNVFICLTRSMSFHEVVDVYLLYVVVISLIYGFEQSVFTIILSVLAKLYITIYLNIETLSLVNEYLYMWILFIFTIGVLVGYLKEQYKIKYTDMVDEQHYLEEQLEDVKKINEINIEVKELYESRLLNYGDSFGRIYEITSKLDLVEPQAIIFKAIRVIQNIMDTERVSIYISSGNDSFYRLIASSAKKTRNFSTSLRTSDYGRIFEKMAKQEIFVNTDLDPDYPMMAGGIYKSGHLQSIIMIWSIPFENNNLYQMNIFEITCRLIESKLNVAYEYMSNISSSYGFKYGNMLDGESFAKTLELYRLGQEEGIVDYSLLTLIKNEQMNREGFVDCVKNNVRETDYIYEKEPEIYVLLANTNKKDSQFVIDRLEAEQLIVKEGECIE